MNLNKNKRENILKNEDELQNLLLAGKLTTSLVIGSLAIHSGLSLETVAIVGADAVLSVGFAKLLDAVSQRKMKKVADALKENNAFVTNEKIENIENDLKQSNHNSVLTLTANGLVLPLQLYCIANIDNVAFTALISLMTVCSTLTIAESFLYERKQSKKLNKSVKSMANNNDERTM